LSTRDPSKLTEGTNLTVSDVDEDRVLLVDNHGFKYEITLNTPDFDQTMVETFIDGLYITDSMHVRRGYKISETTPTVVSIHLMEEVTELIEAVLVSGDKAAIIEEAGDVLGLYLHLLRKAGVKSETVIQHCLAKLSRYWTTDPTKVTAEEVAFGRAKRGEPPA